MLEILIEGALIASGVGLYGREFLQKTKKEETVPEKMDELFEVCGIYTKNGDVKIKPPLLNYKENDYLVYSIPIGKSEDDFKKHEEAIKALLNSRIEIESKGRRLTIHMYNLEQYNYKLPEDWEEKTKDMLIPLIVGKSYEGYEIIDIVDCPHIKIGGTTGKGKTNILRVWLYLLLKHAKVPVEIYLIDLKRVSFTYAKKYIHYAFKLSDAVDIISTLHKEMDERMELLDNNEVDNFRDIPNNTLPYKILILDEISQISPILAKSKTDKKIKEKVHGMLIDMLCLTRALGVHIILSAQRPDRDILPGQMKANLPCSIAFKCVNTVNSEIMLDNNLAAKMPGIEGRAILQFKKQIEIQVPHLPFKEAKRLVKENDNAG